MPFKKGQSGNPRGRPETPERDALRLAIIAVSKEKKQDFYEMAVKRAYRDTKMCIAILNKLIPDLRSDQITMPEGLTVKIVRYSDGDQPSK
jgi:hypothetical protein